MEDTILIKKILARDKHALSMFYHTYTPRLRQFVHARIDNIDDSEEVLQDTLFAFLEGLRDFEGRSSIKTFLYSICQHKIIDFYRRKKIKHVVFSRLPQLEVLISPIMGPEEVLDAKILTDKIQQTLALLIPRYRAILLYKYVEYMSVENIASTLGISFKSAESQLFRARKAFVEMYRTL